MRDTLIPHAELHVHLIGTLSRERLRALADLGYETVIAPDALPAGPGATGRAGFAAWMAAARPWIGAPWPCFVPLAGLYGRDLAAQNIAYAEISISPLMVSRDPDQAAADVKAFTTAVARWVPEGPWLRWLWTLPKWLAPEDLARGHETIRHLAREQLIAGVTFVGTRGRLDPEWHGATCRVVREAGLGLSVHAGEFGERDEVAAALMLGAQRIGHGLAAFEDVDLLARCRRAGMHFEFCLTSNEKTGAVAALRAHPLRQALDAGIACSLNTDDPGLFECSLVSEFDKAQDQLAVTVAEAHRLREQAWAARFAV